MKLRFTTSFLVVWLLAGSTLAQNPGAMMMLGVGGNGSSCTAAVWSTTQIDSNLSGGGTNTVTQGCTNTSATAYGNAASQQTTGKYYFEVGFTTSYIYQIIIGLGNTSSSYAGNYVGDGNGNTAGQQRVNWNFNTATIFSTSWGFVSGDRIAIAEDLTDGYVWVSDVTKATAWYGAATSGNPANGASGNGYALPAGITAHAVVPAVTLYTHSDTATGYFTTASFLGAVPSGYGSFGGC